MSDSSKLTRRAVVLARGLGTRMRDRSGGAGLSEEQAAAADVGRFSGKAVSFMPIARFETD